MACVTDVIPFVLLHKIVVLKRRVVVAYVLDRLNSRTKSRFSSFAWSGHAQARQRESIATFYR